MLNVKRKRFFNKIMIWEQPANSGGRARELHQSYIKPFGISCKFWRIAITTNFINHPPYIGLPIMLSGKWYLDNLTTYFQGYGTLKSILFSILEILFLSLLSLTKPIKMLRLWSHCWDFIEMCFGSFIGKLFIDLKYFFYFTLYKRIHPCFWWFKCCPLEHLLFFHSDPDKGT